MCSTCNQVNVNKVSIKCVHCKNSYHATGTKPKISIPQGITLAPNWRCGSCMERKRLGDSVQNSQPAPSQKTPADFAAQLAEPKTTTLLCKIIPQMCSTLGCKCTIKADRISCGKSHSDGMVAADVFRLLNAALKRPITKDHRFN